MIRALLLSLCIAWPLAAANPHAVTLATAPAMQYPFALAVDRFGNVYVADGGLMRISVWSPATRGMTVFLPFLDRLRVFVCFPHYHEVVRAPLIH